MSHLRTSNFLPTLEPDSMDHGHDARAHATRSDATLRSDSPHLRSMPPSRCFFHGYCLLQAPLLHTASPSTDARAQASRVELSMMTPWAWPLEESTRSSEDAASTSFVDSDHVAIPMVGPILFERAESERLSMLFHVPGTRVIW